MSDYIQGVESVLREAEIARIDQIAESAQKFMSSDSRSFTMWLESNPELVSQVKNYLKGTALLDLGNAGSTHENSRVMKFALACGVTKLEGIDRFQTTLPVGKFTENTTQIENMETKQVTGDMLAYLARLPSGYANIIINGIDNTIIEPYHEETELYLQELRKQIVRVVPAGGVVFGAATDIMKELNRFDSKMEKIEDIQFPDKALTQFTPLDKFRSQYFFYQKANY